MHISVVVITLNEEKNLSRCLQSVQNIADEIVIVDSYSEDETGTIARSFGAKVFYHPFEDYVKQKNFAVNKASHDWILSLDADEALSPELEQSILAVKESPMFNAYELTRLTNYCGKWIRHCGWYPDKKTRLFHKSAGTWVGEQIHESWQAYNKEEKTGLLKGDLLHYSYYSFSDHVKQIEKFTEIAARTAVAKGKKCSFIKMWLAPKWGFFVDYIVRLGILDGYYGFMVCKYSAWAAFVKYSKIRQYSAVKKQKQTLDARTKAYNYQPYG
jgi:glycosyltransferase involved in cell wall biosynthesis